MTVTRSKKLTIRKCGTVLELTWMFPSVRFDILWSFAAYLSTTTDELICRAV